MIPDQLTVRWNQDHLQFELRCDDPELYQRACTVFQYWKTPECRVGIETFIIKASALADGWEFLGSQDSNPVRLPDIPTVIRAAELDAAQAILNRPERFLTVHGGLLAAGDDAVLLVGPSHSGKSTMSCALWAAGWQLLADDVTILDPGAGTAFPLLRRVSLRHPSRELLGDDLWQRMITGKTCDATPEGYVFHPDETEEQSRARSARLRAILFLNRRGVPSPPSAGVSRMPQADALLALSPYTNTVRHLGLGECMARLGGLTNRVPCYDFGRGPLPMMVETVNNLFQPAPAVNPSGLRGLPRHG